MAQRLQLEKETDVAIRAFAAREWRARLGPHDRRRRPRARRTRPPCEELGVGAAVRSSGSARCPATHGAAGLLMATRPSETPGLRCSRRWRPAPGGGGRRGGHPEMLEGLDPRARFAPTMPTRPRATSALTTKPRARLSRRGRRRQADGVHARCAGGRHGCGRTVARSLGDDDDRPGRDVAGGDGTTSGGATSTWWPACSRATRAARPLRGAPCRPAARRAIGQATADRACRSCGRRTALGCILPPHEVAAAPARRRNGRASRAAGATRRESRA